MGVWIETLPSPPEGGKRTVTPCMGVWIETREPSLSRQSAGSHPVWVCGLKQVTAKTAKTAGSHTLYGCVD